MARINTYNSEREEDIQLNDILLGTDAATRATRNFPIQALVEFIADQPNVGNTILSGNGAPTAAIGNDGDFYIDVQDLVFYGPKANVTWPAGISLRGTQGPAGVQGEQGMIGPQGPQGIQGNRGADGADGDPVGGVNITSVTGGQQIQFTVGGNPIGNPITIPNGNDGADGSTGPQGLRGPQGEQGIQGERGERGATGAPGATGARGPQGPQGDPGADSTVPGPAGPAGADGRDGRDGQDGATGATGAQGPRGPRGLQGNIGPAGEGITVATDNGDGTITFGTASNATLITSPNLQGPQGETGGRGPQGPQGPAGNDGADGARGPQGLRGLTGPAGADGAAGAQGPQGDPGPTGPAGPSGTPGATGPQGAQGDPGPMGPQGDDGAVGPMGPAGPRGARGPAGPAGPRGDRGETGVQGPPGDDGADGARGLRGPTGARGPMGERGFASSYLLSIYEFEGDTPNTPINIPVPASGFFTETEIMGVGGSWRRTIFEAFQVAGGDNLWVSQTLISPGTPSSTAWTTPVRLSIGGGGTGSSTFLGLTDTPGSYTGDAGQFLRVNAAADGLEFAAAPSGGQALTAGTGLNITNDVIGISDGGVDTTQLANDSVTRDKINPNVAGSGLRVDVANGAIAVNLATGSGLIIDNDFLEVDPAIAGTGLTFTNGVLNVTGGTGGATALDGLTDVTLTSPANNQVLTYDSATSMWVNRAPSSTGGAQNLNDLGDVTIQTGTDAPSDGQILVYDGDTSQWTNNPFPAVRTDGVTVFGAGTAAFPLSSVTRLSVLGSEGLVDFTASSKGSGSTNNVFTISSQTEFDAIASFLNVSGGTGTYTVPAGRAVDFEVENVGGLGNITVTAIPGHTIDLNSTNRTITFNSPTFVPNTAAATYTSGVISLGALGVSNPRLGASNGVQVRRDGNIYEFSIPDGTANNQVLTWNGTTWVAAAPTSQGGGLSAVTLAQNSGLTGDGTAQNGLAISFGTGMNQALRGNSATEALSDVSNAAHTFTPGDVLIHDGMNPGTYSPGKISSTSIADNAIGSAQIIDRAITPNKMGSAQGTPGAPGTSQFLRTSATDANVFEWVNAPTGGATSLQGLSDVANDATSAAGTGESLIYNGTAWTHGRPTVATDGTIITGNGLSGTPIRIANDSITSTQLAVDSVTNSELANNAVQTANIMDDAVTNDKIGNNAVQSDQIMNGAVGFNKLAPSAQVSVPTTGTGAPLTRISIGGTLYSVGDSGVTTVNGPNGASVSNVTAITFRGDDVTVTDGGNGVAVVTIGTVTPPTTAGFQNLRLSNSGPITAGATSVMVTPTWDNRSGTGTASIQNIMFSGTGITSRTVNNPSSGTAQAITISPAATAGTLTINAVLNYTDGSSAAQTLNASTNVTVNAALNPRITATLAGSSSIEAGATSLRLTPSWTTADGTFTNVSGTITGPNGFSQQVTTSGNDVTVTIPAATAGATLDYSLVVTGTAGGNTITSNTATHRVTVNAAAPGVARVGFTLSDGTTLTQMTSALAAMDTVPVTQASTSTESGATFSGTNSQPTAINYTYRGTTQRGATWILIDTAHTPTAAALGGVQTIPLTNPPQVTVDGSTYNAYVAGNASSVLFQGDTYEFTITY